MENTNSKKSKYSKLESAQKRRNNALNMLQNSLNVGLKTAKDGTKVELSEADKKRITNEINILTNRLKL